MVFAALKERAAELKPRSTITRESNDSEREVPGYWKDPHELMYLKEMRRQIKEVRNVKYSLLEIILALEGKHRKDNDQRQREFENRVEREERRRADDYRFPDRVSPEYWTDLHGLYLKEACRYVDEVLKQSRKKGAKSRVFIVGLGIHSPGRKRVLGPRIQEYLSCGGRNFPVRLALLDHPRPGCLAVYF
jgi:DNA-nicking Smr family endonuclease